MNRHSDECEDCDGTGFVQVWDTDDCADEDNCPCTRAQTADRLCLECRKVNVQL